jgi:hypothetical protein
VGSAWIAAGTAGLVRKSNVACTASLDENESSIASKGRFQFGAASGMSCATGRVRCHSCLSGSTQANGAWQVSYCACGLVTLRLPLTEPVRRDEGTRKHARRTSVDPTVLPFVMTEALASRLVS